jgi:hypothetical protein
MKARTHPVTRRVLRTRQKVHIEAMRFSYDWWPHGSNDKAKQSQKCTKVHLPPRDICKRQMAKLREKEETSWGSSSGVSVITTGKKQGPDGQKLCRRQFIGAVGTILRWGRQARSPSAHDCRRHSSTYADGRRRHSLCRRLGRRHRFFIFLGFYIYIHL